MEENGEEYKREGVQREAGREKETRARRMEAS